jgi:PAS domain S-box-containing protein
LAYHLDPQLKNFDSIAIDILRDNPYVDIVETTKRGVINHVFPGGRNKLVVGYDILSDQFRSADALEAIKRKHIFYGGPYPLMQDNTMAIIGRMPVYTESGDFIGFSVIITRMQTINQIFKHTEQNKYFQYQLSKIDFDSEEELYRLFDGFNYKAEHLVHTDIVEGNWRLYVALVPNEGIWSRVILMSIVAFILAIISGWYVYQLLNEPKKLNAIIRDKSQQLVDSETYYRTLIETSSDGLVLLNDKGEIRYATDSASAILSYSKFELTGHSLYNFIEQSDRERLDQLFLEVQTVNDQAIKVGLRVRLKTGKVIYVQGNMRNLLFNASVKSIVFTFQDISNQVITRQKLVKSSREIELLNKVNDLILHANTEHELCDLICSCIINDGGYRLAWIAGQPDADDETKTVKKLYAAGELKYLSEIQINLSDEKLLKGPTARVLKGERYVITNNVNGDVNFGPWLNAAHKFGISASAVFPVSYEDGAVSATINIYSADKDAFDSHEINVLTRIANNISIAVQSIRNKSDKERTSYLLNERIKELRTIHHVSNILQIDDLTVAEVINKVVEVLPSGMQFVDFCGARVSYDGEQAATLNFKSVLKKIEAEFKTDDGVIGKIEVGYTHDFGKTLPKVFFDEEYELLRTLAELLETYFNKKGQQAALEKSEANLRTIFENTEIGYLLMDKSFMVKAYNAKMYNGYAAETGTVITLENSFVEMLLPDRVELFTKHAEEVIKTKKPVEYQTSFLVGETLTYYNVMLVPIINKGEVIGICLSAFDITRLKKLESERQEHIKVLIERNRDLEQFAYIVSHNLRAPIANIKGLVTLIGNSESADDRNYMVHALEQSSERLDTVVKDLNMILDIRQNIATQQTSVIDLKQVVGNVQLMISGFVQSSNVLFHLNFSSGSLVFGIDAYVDSIFLNLMTNSIKYAHPDRTPEISVETQVEGDNLVVIYRDNGIGIDLEKYRDQLFGFYKRFNNTKEGKGLGLFLIKSHIEALGGTVSIDSKLNEGTTFKLNFRKP